MKNQTVISNNNLKKQTIMKYLMTIAFVALLIPAVKAQKQDKEQVKKDKAAITQLFNDYYFKGVYTGDTTILKQSFDPRTMLFGDKKGVEYSNPVSAYLYAVGHRGSPKDSGKPFKSEIISIDVINTIAVAKTHVKMLEYNYYNFMLLHKVNDHWLIVGKTLSHVDE